MTSFTAIAYTAWLVLLLAWLPGYFRQPKTQRMPIPAIQIATTALIALAFFLLFGRRLGALGTPLIPPNPALGALGAGLCIAAVLFAIWARVTLGKNWSGAVAVVHEGHELVQTGPYRLVRHPIYTGLLFAMLGTALATGTRASYLGVLLALIAFLIRIRIEEQLMTSQFPKQYPTYKERTRALIPFVW